jgi:iron complex outermembrane receptor protein
MLSCRRWLLAALVTTAFVPVVALAQATPGPPAPSGGDDATKVGEVVVTAQKRSEKLTSVPISITAVTGVKLEQAGVTDMSSLGQLVPGFHMDSSGPEAEPTIRGVTTTSTGTGLTANIATYVDGFYRAADESTAFDLNDISSVQVLKGPQGTLFGRNATGGAILVTTLDPSFSPQGTLKVSYGNYDDARANLFATTGVTDNLATSLALYGRTTDGFNHNVVTGQRLGDIRSWSIKNKWLFEPNSKVTFLLTLEHDNVIDPSSVLVNVYNGESSGASVPGTIIATQRGDISTDINPAYKDIYNAVLLKSSFDFDWAKLNSYTGFQEFRSNFRLDLDGTTAPIESVDDTEYDSTFTQEFDLASTGKGQLTWVTGLFYLHAYASQATSVPFDFPISKTTSTINSYAAFADATYQIVPKLFFTLGGRVSVDDVAASYVATFAPISGSPQKTFSAFTPRGVLRYEFTPNSSVYASVSQGTKAGAFNPNGFSSVPVKPERITAYEVGYKYSQHGLQFEAATFYYNYTDLQVSSFLPGQTVSTLLNAAKATIYGGEAHLAYDLTDEVRVDLGGAYTHGRYDSFPGAPLASFDPVTGLVASNPGNAAGQPVTQTPDFNGNVDVDYHRRVLGGMAHLNANYSYNTRVTFDAFGVTQQPAYGLLNLRASWTTPDDKWTAAFYARNATDTKYRLQVIEAAGFLQQWGTPATYGVELTTKF